MWRIFAGVVFVVFFVGTFFCSLFLSQYRKPYHPTGESVFVEIQEGIDVLSIARIMVGHGLVPNESSFLFGSFLDGVLFDMQAGKYRIHTNLSPRDIAHILTQNGSGIEEIKVTFPEGWTAKKMANRLTNQGLPGKSFLDVVNQPPHDIVSGYDFLNTLPKGSSLEGYLFPDTYLFYADSNAEDIVRKMLDTFQLKAEKIVSETIKNRNISFRDAVTMASIIENEVRTTDDRKKVSGIFWKRMNNGMLLQSDATLEYVLQTNAVQHSIDELRVQSPYNTYMHAGLPPSPISNPSIDALLAAALPEESDFYYFLTNPETGKTLFARTFEEHVANKAKSGL